MKKFKNFSHLIWFYISKFRLTYAIGSFSVIAIDVLELLPPIAFKVIMDNAKVGKETLEYKFYAYSILAAFILVGIFRFIWRLCFMYTSRKIEAELKIGFFDAIMSSRYSNISKLREGETVSLLSQDIFDVRMYMGPGLIIFVDMCTYLVIVPFVLYYVFGLTSLLILAPMLLVPFFMPYYEKNVNKDFIRQSELLAKISDFFYENTVGVKVFRVLNLLALRRSKLFNHLNHLYDNRLRIAKFDVTLDAFLSIVVFLSYSVLIYISWLASEGDSRFKNFETLGNVVLALQIIERILWPLMAISFYAALAQKAKSAFHRLKKITNLKQENRSGEKKIREISSIKLNHLSFSFGENKVLKNINLEIYKGQKIGIVGEFGSGKSTLLKILASLYSEDELDLGSEYIINDLNYNKLDLLSLRKYLSYISQEPTIINATIEDNICFNHKKNQNLIDQSIEYACLKNEINSFPQGLKTLIGEKGINLSGGQKQRVALARAFYNSPSLYILDDTISALDVQTERSVVNSISKINKDSILILATHRPSALINFDKVYVLKEGSIVEEGGFGELISKKSDFYNLVEFENKTRSI